MEHDSQRRRGGAGDPIAQRARRLRIVFFIVWFPAGLFMAMTLFREKYDACQAPMEVLVYWDASSTGLFLFALLSASILGRLDLLAQMNDRFVGGGGDGQHRRDPGSMSTSAGLSVEERLRLHNSHHDHDVSNPRTIRVCAAVDWLCFSIHLTASAAQPVLFIVASDFYTRQAQQQPLVLWYETMAWLYHLVCAIACFFIANDPLTRRPVGAPLWLIRVSAWIFDSTTNSDDDDDDASDEAPGTPMAINPPAPLVLAAAGAAIMQVVVLGVVMVHDDNYGLPASPTVSMRASDESSESSRSIRASHSNSSNHD